MVKLLVQFEIDDFTTWKRNFFNNRAQIREAAGSKGATLFTREGNGVVVLLTGIPQRTPWPILPPPAITRQRSNRV